MQRDWMLVGLSACTLAAGVGSVGCDENGTPRSPFGTALSQSEALVWGRVSEADGNQFPVEGATVSVVADASAVPSVTTGSQGDYYLVGVEGPVTVSVDAPGYASQIKSVTGSDQRVVRLDFTLEHDGPPPRVDGHWRLTLTASTRCAASLPPEARHRQYSATLSQDGRDVTVALDDLPRIGTGGNAFSGWLPGVGIRLDWTSDYYTLVPPLLEQIAEGSYFTVDGIGTGTLDARSASGAIDGVFSVVSGPEAWARILNRCAARDHRFLLTRR